MNRKAQHYFNQLKLHYGRTIFDCYTHPSHEKCKAWFKLAKEYVKLSKECCEINKLTCISFNSQTFVTAILIGDTLYVDTYLNCYKFTAYKDFLPRITVY